MHFNELRWPGKRDRDPGPFARLLNKVMRKAGCSWEITRRYDPHEDMMSLEQAANLQLLLASVLRDGLEGDLVEMGCYVGCTSAVIASVLAPQGLVDRFHVYDLFSIELGTSRDIRRVFEENFRTLALPLPRIHAGDILQTLPAQLPERIRFAHIDLGVGGDVQLHARLVTHALEAIYPRLERGAVVALMDLHLPGVTLDGFDANPGMRAACDGFFKNKPEKPVTLYGGPYSHGYFVKA